MLDSVYHNTSSACDVNEIVRGKVLSVEGDEVLVDIGYKSEGMVPLYEWAEDEEKPQFVGVSDLLKHSVDQTLELLRRELEIKRAAKGSFSLAIAQPTTLRPFQRPSFLQISTTMGK